MTLVVLLVVVGCSALLVLAGVTVTVTGAGPHAGRLPSWSRDRDRVTSWWRRCAARFG